MTKGTLQLTLLAAMLAAASASGCATVAVTEYRPLAAETRQPAHDRWDALLSLAAREGWQIESSDETFGKLVALRGDRDSAEIRERITVTVRQEQSIVGIQTEVLFGRDWWTAAMVPGSYSYAREQELAARIEATPSRRLASAR